jgi:chemotaxis-related protein WspD
VHSMKEPSQTLTPGNIETPRQAGLGRNDDGMLNDCWNRIGVRGDRSCPELLRHVHCRNCPVHSAAARTLLDAPAPADFLKLATEHFARPAHTPTEHAGAADALSVIVFRVHAEWFAIRTAACLEIADLRPIHSLPHHREGAVLGLANVRGGLLVCISLAAILGVTAKPETSSKQTRRGAVAQRLLVARTEGGAVVFPLDEVYGVERFRARDRQEVPATVAQAQVTYTQALLSLGDRTVGLLDEHRLFDSVGRSLT